jgi:hypothetical protein
VYTKSRTPYLEELCAVDTGTKLIGEPAKLHSVDSITAAPSQAIPRYFSTAVVRRARSLVSLTASVFYG